MNPRAHWDKIYTTQSDAQVSWTEPEPRASLSLIRQVCPQGRIIDVGGGTSALVDRLLDAGYSVAVLDISAAALDRAKARLGPRADNIRWIIADVTVQLDVGTYDLWHDRAVFHFLTEPADRIAYVALLKRSIPVGGHVVMATFALDGPAKCSGLPVQRYDSHSLGLELGAAFELLQSVPETHLTPQGKRQSFQYSVFRRLR